MSSSNFFTLLADIIKTNTVSSDTPTEDCSNIELIELLKKETEKRGGTYTEETVVESPLKKNLLMKFGNGSGGILLSGHTDTVPYDRSKWNSDPFTLTETEDRLIGLGVIDMKGFFAHVFEAIDSIDLKTLNKPIWILATADEETTMVGASSFVKKHPNFKPDFCMIGEPTSMYPVIQHKGYMAYRIKVIGKSGHSSNPDLGVNALYVMNQIISELLSLEQELKTNYREPSFDIPYPTLNIGSIHGGDSPNRICGECEILFDVRPLITTPCEVVEQKLKDIVRKISDLNLDSKISLEQLYANIDPFKTEATDKYVKQLVSLTGNDAIAVNYCTEASFLRRLGCPVAICGIGSIDNAHQPNEYFYKDKIENFKKVLLNIIQYVCF